MVPHNHNSIPSAKVFLNVQSFKIYCKKIDWALINQIRYLEDLKITILCLNKAYKNSTFSITELGPFFLSIDLILNVFISAKYYAKIKEETKLMQDKIIVRAGTISHWKGGGCCLPRWSQRAARWFLPGNYVIIYHIT